MSAPWYDALGALNILDWLEGLVRGIIYGDVTPHKIRLHHPQSDWWDENPDAQFWNLTDLRRCLKTYHIPCYMHGFNEQHIWTHVKNKQARWAEYLLLRAGAPVIMSTVDGRNAGWASNPKHGGKMPTLWADKPDPSTGSGDVLSSSKGHRTGKRSRRRAGRARRNAWKMF